MRLILFPKGYKDEYHPKSQKVRDNPLTKICVIFTGKKLYQMCDSRFRSSVKLHRYKTCRSVVDRFWSTVNLHGYKTMDILQYELGYTREEAEAIYEELVKEATEEE